MKLTKNFKNKIKKLNIIYLITLFLAIFWVIISFTKNILESSGISNYKFIQRNTVGFWLLISISLSLSKYYYNNLYLAFPIFIILFLIHEFLWYFCYIGITKDEGEVTENWYTWANINLNTIQDIDKLSGTDLTEGMFNNNWNLSNSEALNLKYKTYYDYLKLKPGMDLLDIGCGNCSWINYCKNKGINTTGLTITKSQADFCKSKGINNIIIGDIHKNVLKTINKKFDAITNIGAMEHFTSISLPPQKQVQKIKDYYEQVKNLIKPNSESGRYLNSYMCLNDKYSKHKNLNWYFNVYLIASSFGYGCYLSDNEVSDIYNGNNSKIIIKRDYTEDYRWILVRDKNTWGYANYKFDSLYKISNFIKDLFTDPGCMLRLMYGINNCWFWQFGGAHTYPNAKNIDTPSRSYIYVTKINQ